MSCLFCRISLLTVLLTCCAAYTYAAPVVLFDESHGQKFLISKEGPLHLSELAAVCRESGFSVQSHTGGLTREALSAIDILVISGPFLPLQEDEVSAVLNFIKAGGGVAVMLHVAPLVRDFLFRLEVDFTNGTLREVNQLVADNPLDFHVSHFAEHPVTSGLQSFSVYGAWALRPTAAYVSILAATSQDGWIDLDHNNQLSDQDAVQQFGVMVAGELGKGRFLVLGDDAVFQNRFIGQTNRKLARQMFDWLMYGKNSD